MALSASKPASGGDIFDQKKWDLSLVFGVGEA